MFARQIQELVHILGRLPGLGPRSGKRLALHLLKKREALLRPLIRILTEADQSVRMCSTCGYLDSIDPCSLCTDERRDRSTLCIVADVADVWTIERGQSYNGLYHILGGLLSATEGIGPDQLGLPSLTQRLIAEPPKEIIFALSATLEGQTTLHFIAQHIQTHIEQPIPFTTLAHGVPVGSELDYLDDGTLNAAFRDRKEF